MEALKDEIQFVTVQFGLLAEEVTERKESTIEFQILIHAEMFLLRCYF